jgi:uncharacterized lipoprotein YehR (DUF1307 family)
VDPGPIFVLKLKFAPDGYARKLVAELWLYPDNSMILELSTKCAPPETFQVAAETRAFLTQRGVDLTGEQQTKTKKSSMRPRQRVAPTVLSTCMAIALTACGDDDEPQAEAESALCDSVGQLRDAATEVESLDANSTKDEAQTALDNLSSAVAGVKENAGNLSQADVSALQSATDGVKSAVDNIPGDATLADAAAAVKAAGTSMSAAAQQIEDGVQC